jgi:pimeloyl-ACP methyl ester carboxylesterase
VEPTPTPSDAVVPAYGAAFDKASWAPFASWFAGRAHQVLAIDFRGYGRSTAGTDSHALFEDVLAAVRYLHGRGVPAIFVSQHGGWDRRGHGAARSQQG